MSHSILFMCARSAKENLLITLFNYRYNYKKKSFIYSEKKTSKYIYNFNHLHWKRTELKTLEWWISGFMLNSLFFWISRLIIACFPHEFNLQVSRHIGNLWLIILSNIYNLISFSILYKLYQKTVIKYDYQLEVFHAQSQNVL